MIHGNQGILVIGQHRVGDTLFLYPHVSSVRWQGLLGRSRTKSQFRMVIGRQDYLGKGLYNYHSDMAAGIVVKYIRGFETFTIRDCDLIDREGRVFVILKPQMIIQPEKTDG